MKNKRYFKPGDRVKYIEKGEALCGQTGKVCGLMLSSPDYVYVRFDNQELGQLWTLLEDEMSTYPALYTKKHFKAGDKYYIVNVNHLILEPRKKSTKRYDFDKPAIKEKVEQEEVIRLTNDFIQKLKEAWQ